MDNNILRQTQEMAYKILIEFDRFCANHNLTYYLSSGSLLGAVRHGGFIPWDDDIDVSMPREDYEKLINDYIDDLPNNLKLEYYKNTDFFPLNFAKIVNINTTIVEKTGKDKYRVSGAFIDVFPIDGAGNTYKQAIRRRKSFKWILALIPLSAYKPDDKKRSLWKRLVIKIASIFNTKKLQDILSYLLKKKSYSKCKYVAVYVGQYGLKEIMPKDVYGVPSKVKFIDEFFNAPQDINAFLTAKYGDYMKLPPEEKRISLHNFIYVNLNQSYKDFKLEDLKIEQ